MNCMSLVVIIPTSFERRVPFSVINEPLAVFSHNGISHLSNRSGKRFSDKELDLGPHSNKVASEERKLFFGVHQGKKRTRLSGKHPTAGLTDQSQEILRNPISLSIASLLL